MLTHPNNMASHEFRIIPFYTEVKHHTLHNTPVHEKCKCHVWLKLASGIPMDDVFCSVLPHDWTSKFSATQHCSYLVKMLLLNTLHTVFFLNGLRWHRKVSIIQNLWGNLVSIRIVGKSSNPEFVTIYCKIGLCSFINPTFILTGNAW